MPTFSFDLTAGQATALQVALGEARTLGRPATPAEVKAWLADQARSLVQGREERLARASFVPTPFDPA